MAYREVLARRDLSMLWLSQLLSAVGDHLFIVAVTWFAVDAAGRAAGIVSAVGLGAGLLFGLFGGAYADRLDRRRTMIAVDLLRAIIVGLLPLLALSGSLRLWHLVLLTVLMETLGALFDPAFQGELPAICEDAASLHAMNALMSSNHRFARIFGPGMTGLLLLVMPLPHFFTMDAISFAISAVGLSLIRPGTRPPCVAGPTSSPISDVFAGFAALVRHRPLCWAVVSLGLINMAWSAAFMVGVPLLARQALPGGAGAYGLIAGAYGVGNVLSLLVTGAMAQRKNLTPMFMGQITLGVGFLIVAVSGGMVPALAGTVLAAFGSPIGDLIMLNMIQSDFPREHIGKIYSVRSFVGNLGLALGLLAAAPLFGRLSPPVGLGLCAAAIIATGATGLLARLFR